MAEQLSVMSETKLVEAEALIEIIPDIRERNLPMLTENKASEQGNNFQEREILYKLLFDMKSDLNDLKSLVFELIRDNNLQVSNPEELMGLDSPNYPEYNNGTTSQFVPEFKVSEAALPRQEEENEFALNPTRPIILDNNQKQQYDSEEVEENLSLEENEKELIRKALRKHRGRRKEAANDLGISERTLYRKIKQYEL